MNQASATADGIKAAAQRIAMAVDSQRRGHTLKVKPLIQSLRDQLAQLDRQVAA